MPRRRRSAGEPWRGVVLPAIPGPPQFLQTHTWAAILRGEFDTHVFPLVLDFGEDLNGPSNRAIAGIPALYGGQVDTGLLGTLVRRPTSDRTQRANLFRSQHALAEFHQNSAILQVQSKSVQED